MLQRDWTWRGLNGHLVSESDAGRLFLVQTPEAASLRRRFQVCRRPRGKTTGSSDISRWRHICAEHYRLS